MQRDNVIDAFELIIWKTIFLKGTKRLIMSSLLISKIFGWGPRTEGDC
jgi:hypothetical protein